jgi:Flp pilus assembly pilin Flp
MLTNRLTERSALRTFVHDEHGLSTVEYVIILVLIAAAAVGVWSTLGTTIKAKIGSANDEIDLKVQISSDSQSGKTE